MKIQFWKRENFNSQPHKEADRELFQYLVTLALFQLTASQGG